MRKTFKGAIKNTAEVTSNHLRIIRKNTEGGTINERQNHGGSADLLYGSPLTLPGRPASPENLVDTGTIGGDRLSSYRRLSFATKQASVVAHNPVFCTAPTSTATLLLFIKKQMRKGEILWKKN
jgi:hypothetical protein